MDVLAQWKRIPARVDAMLANGKGLDDPSGTGGLTRRQLVHHLTEANVVAAGIVIAGLGSPGCVFDWSWMLPFGPWLDRMDYGHKPIEPARLMLEAVNAYLVAQIEPLPDGLTRELRLRDTPDGEPRTVSVAQVLLQEIEHAMEHLDEAGA